MPQYVGPKKKKAVVYKLFRRKQTGRMSKGKMKVGKRDLFFFVGSGAEPKTSNSRRKGKKEGELGAARSTKLSCSGRKRP